MIITHGLDTLIETATHLASTALLKERTIVLTGASQPQKFADSDAPFNVGAAVAAISLLSPGCFICMNGRVMEASRCRRDGRTGHFVYI